MASAQPQPTRAWPSAARLVGLIFLVLSGCASIPPRQDAELRYRRISAETYGRILYRKPLREENVVELSRKRVPNSSIIYFLYITRSHFELSSRDRARLRARGVRSDVVGFMAENEPSPWLLTFF